MKFLQRLFRVSDKNVLPKNLISKDSMIVLPGESYSPQEYVLNLVDQLEADIFPLFKVQGAAPFTIIRNSFCYVDHISRLFYGKNGKNNNQSVRMRKIISQFADSDEYMNNNYQNYAPYLIQLYRHDLVHNIRPLPKQIKVMKDGELSNETSWFFIFSKHDYSLSFDDFTKKFQEKRFRNGFGHLRYTDNQIAINTQSLFFDLVIFLKKLAKKLEHDKNLQKKFIKNYNKIIDENYFKIDNRIILDKDANKEIINVFHNK